LIGTLHDETSDAQAHKLALEIGGQFIKFLGRRVIVSGSSSHLAGHFEEEFSDVLELPSDAQLSSSDFMDKRQIKVGEIHVGLETVPLILGPCSIESEGQIRQVAEFVKHQDLNFIRGSAFKPRTTPYGFQGLGVEGMQLIRKVADDYGLKVVSETRDTRDVDSIIEYADVIQIGTKAMYDYALLDRAAKSMKPILLKRGFGTTIQEFLQIAEFVLLAGNSNLILCERGIRTFESKSRFTLDLAGAIYVLHHANLPLFVDPSHAMGHRWGVSQLGLGALAAGADGLLVEMHPDPESARTDAAQQIDFSMASELVRKSRLIAEIDGRKIV
jgi:3-deoxy-7-phosphoheptulonate synthase